MIKQNKNKIAIIRIIIRIITGNNSKRDINNNKSNNNKRKGSRSSSNKWGGDIDMALAMTRDKMNVI